MKILLQTEFVEQLAEAQWRATKEVLFFTIRVQNGGLQRMKRMTMLTLHHHQI